MLREYQITNFKAFAGPETMPIRPITLIYGPNSSGKSSILQSLLLLKQTLEDEDNSTALLPKGKLLDLGNHKEFIHRHDPDQHFSFKVLFTLDDTDRPGPEWVKEFLQSLGPEPMGLKIDFAYDKKTRVVGVSSLAIFSGDKNLLVHDFFPGLGGAASTTITRTHNSWERWWAFTKASIEDVLDRAKYVFYKDELYDIEGGESPEELFHDLANSSFERAMKELEVENRLFAVDSQNFLPASKGSLPAKFFKKLVAWLKETETEEETQVQPSQSPSPTDSSEGQSTEDSSLFDAHIYHGQPFESEPFGLRELLDVFPITLQVCSAFRQLVKDIVYLGPLRSYPERYYTFSGTLSEEVGQSGERMPDVLFRNRGILAISFVQLCC